MTAVTKSFCQGLAESQAKKRAEIQAFDTFTLLAYTFKRGLITFAVVLPYTLYQGESVILLYFAMMTYSAYDSARHRFGFIKSERVNAGVMLLLISALNPADTMAFIHRTIAMFAN